MAYVITVDTQIILHEPCEGLSGGFWDELRGTKLGDLKLCRWETQGQWHLRIDICGPNSPSAVTRQPLPCMLDVPRIITPLSASESSKTWAPRGP